MDLETYSIFASLLFSVFIFFEINKVFFNARSVAKRKYGYIIIDIETEEKASELKCMLRNVTIFIWPIEVLATIINPSRRLGDLLARTKVVNSEKIEVESLLIDIKNMKPISRNTNSILASILVSLIFSILFNPVLIAKIIN